MFSPLLLLLSKDAPEPTKVLHIRNKKANSNNQNLILFIRGKAMSKAPLIKEHGQSANPPIM